MKPKMFLILVLSLLLLIGTVSANVTDTRTYFEEDTSIPFEIWVLMFGAGLLFLVLSASTGFSGNGGLTLVFGIVSTLFLSGAAFATPVTGFYSYIVNTTTNSTTQATPVVWLVFQPWMMWMVWGLATISFILFVFGVLILFQERAHEEDMQWV